MEASTTKADIRQWLEDHAQPPVTVGMGQSIALNVAALTAGVAIWHLKRWCRHLRRSSQEHGGLFREASERLLSLGDYSDYTGRNAFEFSDAFLGPTFHGTALNYLIFLRIAAEMCTTLTVVSTLLVIPHWGVQPLLLGGQHGRISLAPDINAEGICLLCLLATVFGVVVLMFTQRMKVHMRVRSAMHPQTMPFLDRTVWLTHLPVGDYLTGRPFTLTDQEFEMVEQSLTRAIEEQIREKLQVSEEKAKKAIVRVHVPFVVDKWYDLDTWHKETNARLKMKQEQLSSLQAELHQRCYLCRCFPRLHIWQLSRQVQRLERKAETLKHDLDAMELAAKRMSGSAFVTFQDRKYKATLLNDIPSCWKFHSYAYFNFGQPPFSSVTLRCRRAPHPADVLWENLHVPSLTRAVRFTIAALLLLVFMVVVVTPVSVSSELNTIIPELRKGSHVMRQAVEQRLGVSLPDKRGVWRWMSLQLPTMIILFINSLLLPLIIGEICRFTRSHTLSKVEVNQMLMNYVFLVMNQLLIPLLGLTGIPALLEFLEVRLAAADQKQDISVLQLLDGSMFSSPGLFYVRYLLNCTFLTNTNSLLNLSQLTVRWLLSQPEPWIFPWGYWYAFTLAILTTAVSLGVLVPSLLPIGALFFAMKYRIDKHLLSVRGFLCGPESQGMFIPRVLFIMRMIVAGLWLVIGSSLHFTAGTFFRDRWTAPVPLKAVEWYSALLVGAAVIVWFWSSWSKANALHNDKFELLRFSKKEKNCWDRCLDSVFGKLQQDLEKHWPRAGPPRVDRAGRFPSEDLSLSLGSLAFTRRDSAEVEEQLSGEVFGLVWHCRSWLASWTEYAARRNLPADLFCLTYDGRHEGELMS